MNNKRQLGSLINTVFSKKKFCYLVSFGAIHYLRKDDFGNFLPPYLHVRDVRFFKPLPPILT